MSSLARPLPGRRKPGPASATSSRSTAPVAYESGRYQLEGWETGALIFLVLIALCFGVMELYSASSLMARENGDPAHYFALRQLGGAAIGFVIAVVLARLDYRRLRFLAWPLLLLSLLSLLIVIMPGTESIAPRINGARRWIHLGIDFQPSEVAKLSLIIWTAALTVKKQEKLHSLSKGLLPFLIVWLAVGVLILLQPNYSAALLLILLSALVLFAGGARIGHFIVLTLAAIPILWNQIENTGYRLRRITAFLDASGDTSGARYQIHQSLIAVGSGGVTGVGFGGSRQKFGFLPEPHNDFLFAMIGEEWGLIGVCLTLLLFLAIAVTGYRIARAAPDLFGYLLGIGMTNLIVVSALLHMGVALSLLPTTGVNLPFMSYGRTGLLVAFAAIGVLLSIGRSSMGGKSA